MLIRCEIDPSIERVEIDGFKFPLGVYPVEPIEPRAGYRVEFEPADGVNDPQFEDEVIEPWPDRYVFDIVISADRVDALYRQLLPLLPGRVYPILDFIGHDAHREIDPYLARVPVGIEWLIDGVRACRPFFFEDGMVGFGALSDDPFCHLFVDEHKIITLRCEPDLKPRFEKILAAFDLKEIEDPAGADAAAHEHRNVLWTPDDRPDLLSAEEIVEDLRDAWQLDLNVDITRNVDDGGRELGITPWRCVVRTEGADRTRYAEIIVNADCLLNAEELAIDATIGLLASDETSTSDDEPMIIVADRMTPAQLEEAVSGEGSPAGGEQPHGTPVKEPSIEPGVIQGRWLA